MGRSDNPVKGSGTYWIGRWPPFGLVRAIWLHSPIWLVSCVFGLHVGVQCRIRQVLFAAATEVVSVHIVLFGPSFGF